MKPEKFTVSIDRALWWDRNMLLREIEKPELRGSMLRKALLLAMDSPHTQYCEDAPAMAMVNYLHRKQCEIDSPFTVVMKVRTVDGKEHKYTVCVGEMNFATKNLEDLVQELVRPESLKLVRGAAKELKFEEVALVTSYVEDDSLDEFDQEQHRAAAEARGCV